MKSALPEKVSFGDKKRPEVLGVLAKKAEDKKKKIKEEKRAAEEARYVLGRIEEESRNICTHAYR